MAMCCLVVAVGAACGGENSLPTMPLEVSGSDGTTQAYPTVTELIQDSYVVARGRFTGKPAVVQTSRDGENLVTQQVVWEFVPDEVYRDVRAADSSARRTDERRGSFLIGASVNDVETMRGDTPVAEFVRTRPSTYNLNSYVVDRPTYVFLRPGRLPSEVVQRDPELANIMILAAPSQCYAVDGLRESCAYVADSPGGQPLAKLEREALIPRGLSVTAIQEAGSVSDVVGSELFASTQPIDVQQYTVIPGSGGEG